jgi:hypothetical protein
MFSNNQINNSFKAMAHLFPGRQCQVAAISYKRPTLTAPAPTSTRGLLLLLLPLLQCGGKGGEVAFRVG